MPRHFTALLALAVFCLPGLAQNPVRGKLYTKTVGETVHAVVELRVEEGWHIYWTNPGDSGLPTRLTFPEQTGLDFGPVQYPLPDRFVAPGEIEGSFSCADNSIF